MYGLLDINNYYCEAERVFDAKLVGVPLVVLGNNDGCCISRSNEARALGIKMGQPWHEVRHFARTHGLQWRSPNFALYGDLSDRVMSLATDLCPEALPYSIDEAFLVWPVVRGDLYERAVATRARILQWLGLPCCIGIAATRTLAKLANHTAKSAERKPGSYPARYAQVCDLSRCSQDELQAILQATEVTDVWGVGARIGAQLNAAGIATALDLAKMDPVLARRRWSITLERTVRELQGLPCIPQDDINATRQQIACTRSFGSPVSTLPQLEQAVSEFATRAAAKLRKQGSHAAKVIVFVRTSPFRDCPQFSRSICIPLPSPGSDTALIVGATLAALRQIFEPGYQISKAGVMLLDLSPEGRVQLNLGLDAPAAGRDRARLMQAMDAINDRWGNGTLTVGSVKPEKKRAVWAMRQAQLSPAYTTTWDGLPVALAI